MNNVHTAMTGNGGSKYPAPVIPVTPSATINNMLNTRFNHGFDSPIKYGVAVYICMVFQAINTVYGYVNQKKPAVSHTFWMVACGIVSFLLLIKSYLMYQILMISSVLLGFFVYYGFLLLGFAGVGLGVAGAVFFDKEGEKPAAASTMPPKFTPSAPAPYTENKFE